MVSACFSSFQLVSGGFRWFQLVLTYINYAKKMKGLLCWPFLAQSRGNSASFKELIIIPRRMMINSLKEVKFPLDCARKGQQSSVRWIPFWFKGQGDFGFGDERQLHIPTSPARIWIIAFTEQVSYFDSPWLSLFKQLQRTLHFVLICPHRAHCVLTWFCTMP